MIIEPDDPNRTPPIDESTHELTDDELTKKEAKQIEADDQAIQTILMGLPKDIYAAIDSYDTAQEIWLRVEQMMKGSDIGAQEKKAKLFNKWERFNSTKVQNTGNQVVQNAVQNLGIQNNGNQNRLIVPRIANQNANQNENGNVVAARAEGNGNRNNEAVIQLQAEEFDLMDAIGDIEEVNVNSILMANLQQAPTSGTQTDKAPVYDLDGSTEVHQYENCYDNEIFNMFTQEELYIELLEPTTGPYLDQQNDSNVIPDDSNIEHSREIVEQHHATIEETRAFFESLYINLVIEFEKVNMVNHKIKEANADLTTKLARYKG
ncbi:hypothetical protein Tco_1428716 [Tanacetum coccineum]